MLYFLLIVIFFVIVFSVYDSHKAKKNDKRGDDDRGRSRR